jgi:hypothetical protein
MNVKKLKSLAILDNNEKVVGMEMENIHRSLIFLFLIVDLLGFS